MKRKILSIVVTLALCLGMLPSTAGAAASPQTIYLNPGTPYPDGIAAGNDGNDGLTAETAVLTLKKALDLAGEGGTIIVMQSVSLQPGHLYRYFPAETIDGYSRIMVEIKNVTFRRGESFLNNQPMFVITGDRYNSFGGYTPPIGVSVTLENVIIDGGSRTVASGSGARSPLIEVCTYGELILNSGAELRNNQSQALLIDSLPSGDDKKYAAKAVMNPGSSIHDNATTGVLYPAGVEVADNTTFIMNGGEIYNNTVSDAYAAAVAVKAGATFEMQGSSIRNNKNTGFGSGGVCVEAGGKFIMRNGASIRNNETSGWYGGGVGLDGACAQLIMEGGSIQENTALPGDYSYAGGIYNNGGTIQMSGGTISGNSAGKYGGGIYNCGTFQMNDGTISGNTASKYGGGVYNGATIQMNGGTISGNTAVTYGGGIYSVRTGTLHITSGTVADNICTASPDIFAYGSSISLGGPSARIANLELYSNPSITVTASRSGAEPIRTHFLRGATVGSVVAAYDSGLTPDAGDFLCTNPGFMTVAQGNQVVLAASVTVTLDRQNGSQPEELTILSGTTLSQPADPVRGGYTFTGWFTDAACSTPYDWSAPVTEDLRLYAGWLSLYADYTAVDAALAKVPADLSAYTEESAAALRAAVDAVVWNLSSTEQAQVDGFAAAIEAALAGLVQKPEFADYTAVNAALAKVPADLSAYTEESAAALRAAVDAVVWNLSSTEQAQVDGFAAAIEAALAGLTEKPAVEDPVEPPSIDPPFVFPDLPFPDFTVPSVPDVPDITPVTPDAPDTDASLPVRTDSQNGTSVMETTAVPPVTIQNGSAAVTVDAAIGGEIVRQAVEHGSEAVVIAPEIPENVNEATITLPVGTVGELGSRTSASLIVATPAAQVTIPNGGLGTLAAKEGDITVAARKEGDIVALAVTADGEPVEQIPGGITLTVPVENVTPGTVATLVRANGTREVIRKSAVDGDAVVIPLEGSAVVEILDNSRPFSDVPSDSWMADAVSFVSARELLGGVAPDVFAPDSLMSRGMLAAALHNLEGNPSLADVRSFSDVAEGAWYANGVQWAAASGIVEGYSVSRFGPEDPISRQQLAAILWRYAGRPAPSNLSLPFSDADQAEDWALDALRWAVEQGVMSGKGSGRLDPAGPATRAEAAQMLKNLLERRSDRKG